jgi:hypothetical protein
MGSKKKRITQIREKDNGFVMITVLMMLALLSALFGAYYSTTGAETSSVRYSRAGSSSFYASEAGLNIRAEAIRQVFVDYNRPTGTSPTATNPCIGANLGSGSFACMSYLFNLRTVKTYVSEDASNPVILTIPPGERYQNLNAQEYRFTTVSTATNKQNKDEAKLELRFKSRLVPLFQFAAFYNKDLEILPGPNMTLSGPVHTNGDLYLYSNSAALTITGQVTTAGNLWRGRKNGAVGSSCNNQQVYIFDPASARSLLPNCPTRSQITKTQISPWNGMIQMNVQPVTIPAPAVFAATPGQIYWDKADLRLVLSINAGGTVVGVQVRNSDDSVNASATTTLNACAGSINTKAVGTNTMFNFRENATIRLLDVDLQATFNCLRNSNWFGTGKLLSDSTEGGIVMHLTVKGPNSNLAKSNYGVRVRNGAELASNVAGSPTIKGLTIVSDQAAYVMGNYNITNKKPAAVMADSINELSGAWNDANSAAGLGSRVATSTTYNLAFLGGTDVSGGIEGTAGQGGSYNGGLENYPRFHEDWSGRVNMYRGSFVSLGVPQHANGQWSAQSYAAPNRDWNYDTSFNDAANLPPITPRFVYLKQELFVRDFDG